jgi:hypothetical protein
MRQELGPAGRRFWKIPVENPEFFRQSDFFFHPRLF